MGKAILLIILGTSSVPCVLAEQGTNKLFKMGHENGNRYEIPVETLVIASESNSTGSNSTAPKSTGPGTNIRGAARS